MRTVHELTQEELQELRGRYYHQLVDDGSLEEVIGVVCDESEIPMDIVKTNHEGYFFVEEDFWCNLKN